MLMLNVSICLSSIVIQHCIQNLISLEDLCHNKHLLVCLKIISFSSCCFDICLKFRVWILINAGPPFYLL